MNPDGSSFLPTFEGTGVSVSVVGLWYCKAPAIIAAAAREASMTMTLKLGAAAASNHT